MLTTIQSAITTALSALEASPDVPLFKDVGIWQGNLDEATKNTLRLPAAWVLLSGIEFTEPYTRPSVLPPCRVRYTVVLVLRNLAGPGKKTGDSYGAIDQVVASLAGLATGYGLLQPTGVELVTVERGLSAYAVTAEVEYYGP